MNFYLINGISRTLGMSILPKYYLVATKANLQIPYLSIVFHYQQNEKFCQFITRFLDAVIMNFSAFPIHHDVITITSHGQTLQNYVFLYANQPASAWCFPQNYTSCYLLLKTDKLSFSFLFLRSKLMIDAVSKYLLTTQLN